MTKTIFKPLEVFEDSVGRCVQIGLSHIGLKTGDKFIDIGLQKFRPASTDQIGELERVGAWPCNKDTLQCPKFFLFIDRSSPGAGHHYE